MVCVDCGESKPDEDFYFRDKAHSKRFNHCKECSRKRVSKYYGRYSARIKAQRGQRYAENRAQADAIKTTSGCVDCGNSDPRVLDFDHIRGKKTAGVSKLLTGGDR